ncbi:sarcolemmal membrane-associated protein isoform X1 [Strongylocentrotus purpuratus]|uniref:Sarcolemmal membrane-associated protein n=2 Tax=Strongylocentrotus purpuratus TaxID=7668 RepID=A0A7M7N0G9_STRPU|nr:sarcolemmal membrane-associated protein isoform X1 [Strongylocentrotus purpuratus]
MVTMTSKAVFKCHPSSHHFDERHIRLTEPVKIGRSVAKARPTLDNGIFDCKVLSRNHALIWYDFDLLKFFLQDTKSSNGTFVNNNRLSRGSEESPAHEICSGDIIQFGVDVMENSRRGVVTHGCIVAQLSLFHQDGTEATRSDSSLVVPPGFNGQSVQGNNNVPSQELYQLSHYLKEALHREQMLEQKLVALQRLVSSTQEATDSSWQALIDEDRLLSRLEVVENQLRAYSKANTEESIRKELIALQEDKSNYEKTVKDSLKKALEEKLEACRKVADTERMLSNSEDECAHVREELENLKQEQDMLLEKYSQLEKDSQELLQKMNETDRLNEEELERMKEEQNEVQGRLIALQMTESALGARAEELQAENDFIKDQLLSTKERLEEAQEALKRVGSSQTEADVSDQDQEEKEEDEKEAPSEEDKEGEPAKRKAGPGEGDEIPVHHISLLTNGDDRTPTRESGVQVESLWREATKKEMNGRVTDTTDGAMMDSVKTLKNTAEESVLREVTRKKFELEEAEQRIAESNKMIVGLKNELSQAHQELQKHSQEINSLELRLQDTEEHTRAAVEEAVAELRERLSPQVGFDSQDNDSETSSIQTLVEEDMIMVKEQERQLAAAPGGGILSSKESSSSATSLNTSGDSDGRLQNHVQDETTNSSGLNETLLEIDTLKDELHTLRQKYSQLATENESLGKQLETAHQEAKVATDNATTLKGNLEEAEKSSSSVKAQLPSLQEKLRKESGLVQHHRQEIEGLQKNLAEATQSASSSKTELLQCKDKIITLSGDLKKEKQVRQQVDIKQVAQIATLQAELDKERKGKAVLERQILQLQKRIAELEELEKQRMIRKTKDPLDKATSPSDDGDLKSAVSSLEADLESSRQERNKLKEEVTKLQKLLSESESGMRRIADSNSDASTTETVDFTAEKENLQRQLTKANEEVERLQASPSANYPDVDLLKQRLETVTQELNRANDNNAMVQMKWLPVCVIGIAIIAAVFQTFLAMRVEV